MKGRFKSYVLKVSSHTWERVGMSLKRERVEHLDHQCELNAPVIINIVAVIVISHCHHHIPNKSIDLLIPDVVAEDKQSVLDVTSRAQRADQLSQVGFPVVHLVTIMSLIDRHGKVLALM